MFSRLGRRLRNDRRGVAAIEFAILAIPLFIVIMSGIEFGFMMLTKARLSGTLQQAARMATTGDDETNGPNGEKIDAMVKAVVVPRTLPSTSRNRTTTALTKYGKPRKKIAPAQRRRTAGSTSMRTEYGTKIPAGTASAAQMTS
jgi:Flp pilus assembly pilin Flp